MPLLRLTYYDSTLPSRRLLPPGGTKPRQTRQSLWEPSNPSHCNGSFNAAIISVAPGLMAAHVAGRGKISEQRNWLYKF
jgi:hypothetical protein